MPSELSEEGHHTNPAQNQLIMNDEYKRMLVIVYGHLNTMKLTDHLLGK